MQHFLSDAGYGAIVLFAFIEVCCIPIPSEVTFGFAGVLAASGKLNFALVVLVGTLAEMAGSFFAYGVGRVGGRPLVDRLGRYVLLTKRDLDRAERFLSGRGELAVTVGRMLPVLRAFISIVAGTADMSAVRFGVFNLIGTLAYIVTLTSIGYAVGGTWHKVANDFALAGYILVALVVVVIVAAVLHRLRTLRREGSEPISN